MKGGARARAGRPALPAAIHMARGTFRQDRHHAASGLTPPEWLPTPVDLERLGAAGRELIDRVLSDYAMATIDGLRLLEAAAICDKVASFRALDRTALTPTDAAAADRAELSWRVLY